MLYLGVKTIFSIPMTLFFIIKSLVKKVQLLLRINSNNYLVKQQETGIIWLLFLVALAINKRHLNTENYEHT